MIRVFNLILVRLLVTVMVCPLGLEAQQETTTFSHVEIHSGSGSVLPDAQLVIQNGRIVSVGQPQARQSGTTIDLSGKVVIPGLIDANSGLEAGQGFNFERDHPIMPNLRVEDSIEPLKHIFAGTAARATGLVVAYISPGNWRPINGQGVILQLGGQTLLDMKVRGTEFLHFSVSEDPLFTYGLGSTMPQTHMGDLAAIRLILIKARQYLEKKRAFESGKEKCPPPYDADLETVSEVLTGRRIARIDCDSAIEIQRAIALADEFGFRPILEHCTEAYKVRDALVVKRFPVLLLPYTQGDVYDLETEQKILTTPAWLASHGVPVAFQTAGMYANFHSYSQPRNVFLDAILQVRSGMDREEVLKALTTTPAQILGIADRTGSLEAGKEATFVVLDGPPFEYTTHVLQVWIQGRKVFDSKTQSILYQ
jgi:imidazolonepropionase-like amidohydrolase